MLRKKWNGITFRTISNEKYNTTSKRIDNSTENNYFLSDDETSCNKKQTDGFLNTAAIENLWYVYITLLQK